MQIIVGIITISDRASKGLYDDLGGPALKEAAEGSGWKVTAEALVPDEWTASSGSGLTKCPGRRKSGRGTEPEPLNQRLHLATAVEQEPAAVN